MCKKIGMAALAVVAGLFILNSTHLGSYAKTGWKKLRTAAKSQISPQFTLDTIRNEIAQLGPEMNNYVNQVARQEVEVSSLRGKIKELHVSLDRQTDVLRLLNEELEKPSPVALINGEKLNRNQLQREVENRLQSCKNCRTNLERHEKDLAQKEKLLTANKKQLMEMKDLKRKLTLEADALELQLKTLEVAETRSNTFRLDDSRVNRIKEMMEDVRNTLQVKQKEAELWNAVNNDAITVEGKAKVNKDLTKEVSDFLGTTTEEGPKTDVVRP